MAFIVSKLKLRWPAFKPPQAFTPMALSAKPPGNIFCLTPTIQWPRIPQGLPPLSQHLSQHLLSQHLPYPLNQRQWQRLRHLSRHLPPHPNPAPASPAPASPAPASPAPASPAPANAPAANPPNPSVDLPVLRLGTHGPAVVRLQERLKTLGFYSGALDGVFGAGTEAAVQQMQRRHNLEDDGVVGPATWSVIFR
jgi:Putative peptidoglycan binding domain